jgi:hypothetical protein
MRLLDYSKGQADIDAGAFYVKQRLADGLWDCDGPFATFEQAILAISSRYEGTYVVVERDRIIWPQQDSSFLYS